MDGCVSTRVTCLSEATVAGFLERRLSNEQRAEVEVHVDDCEHCRRVLIELVSGISTPSTVADEHTTYPARPAGASNALAKGTMVGRFVVLDLLGAGGMGIVYTAYDPELDRKVALKLLHPGARDVSDTRAHLLAEAQAMARISHANVVAIYDVGTYREQVFAAMELVEGTTLRKWMAERSRTWRQVVDVFLLAGEGLAAAHAASLVHRDFKPENVLLGSDGRVKVSDFGLATAPSATTTHIAGTPGYLPVEAFQPGGVDERGDQFSFCVAFHEALHGSRPFSAQAFEELVAEVQRGPALERGIREVPARLNHVVRRGLALAPADRYPSMRELLADVRRTVVARRMRRLVVAAIGTLAFVIGATTIVVGTRAPANRPPCMGATEQLAGVWDRARRDAVKAAFLRTATPLAASSFERAASVIDRYASDWVTTRTEACEATEVRHEQSAALLDLRLECLDRARIQLRALGDALVMADVTAVREAATAGAALPALEVCNDTDALRGGVTPPFEAAARAQIPRTTAANDATELDAGKFDTRPGFRLPFGCGETWQLTYQAHHPHAGSQIDFYLPNEQASAGFAVFASSPGWVSEVAPGNGEVEINHGGGWFTTYQHMTDISVSLHQYVGRGHVIGKVGNINAKNALGGPEPAHLHYEQTYEPGVTNASFDRTSGPGNMSPYLEGETFNLGTTGTQIRTSTNNCFGGGAPGGSAQYDVPISRNIFSRSRSLLEIWTRRSDNNTLFARWYNRGWWEMPLSQVIVGQPAVAVFEGELHVIARKSDGTIFDLRFSPFTGWKTTYLSGAVAGDPDVAVYGWGKSLRVAARGTDGYLYQWWTAADGAWTSPVRVGNVGVVGAPALFSHYDTFYIVARASDNSLWSWELDRRGRWMEWQVPGAANDTPDIGVDPHSGLVNIVARGTDNRIYRWQSKDPDWDASHQADGWNHPELVDAGHVVTGAPATTIQRGAMHIIARGSNNAVHHWWKDTTWHWEATAGTFSSDPDVVSFGQQLQTIGRGMDGNLYTVWYDPMTRVWARENHGVPVAE
jgi:hypothetical protein